MSAAGPIRVVLADSNHLLRGALGLLLTSSGKFTIVASVETCQQAIDACLRDFPHVATLNLGMPGSPFDAARAIKARCEGCAVVFISENSHAWYIEAAIDVGAHAFVCVSDTPEAFTGALRLAARGKHYVSPEVASRVVIDAGGIKIVDPRQGALASLSPREIEVLRFVAQGLSKKEIADSLHLSVKTIENHASSLMNRLDIHDRVGLTRLAIREGLVEP